MKQENEKADEKIWKIEEEDTCSYSELILHELLRAKGLTAMKLNTCPYRANAKIRRHKMRLTGDLHLVVGSNNKLDALKKHFELPVYSVRTVQRKYKDFNMSTDDPINLKSLALFFDNVVSKIFNHLQGERLLHEKSGSSAVLDNADDDIHDDDDIEDEHQEDIEDEHQEDIILNEGSKSDERGNQEEINMNCLQQAATIAREIHELPERSFWLLLSCQIIFDVIHVRKGMMVSTRTNEIWGIADSNVFVGADLLTSRKGEVRCNQYEVFLLRHLYTKETMILACVGASDAGRVKANRFYQLSYILAYFEEAYKKVPIQIFSSDNDQANLKAVRQLSLPHDPVTIFKEDNTIDEEKVIALVGHEITMKIKEAHEELIKRSRERKETYLMNLKDSVEDALTKEEYDLTEDSSKLVKMLKVHSSKDLKNILDLLPKCLSSEPTKNLRTKTHGLPFIGRLLDKQVTSSHMPDEWNHEQWRERLSILLTKSQSSHLFSDEIFDVQSHTSCAAHGLKSHVGHWRCLDNEFKVNESTVNPVKLFKTACEIRDQRSKAYISVNDCTSLRSGDMLDADHAKMDVRKATRPVRCWKHFQVLSCADRTPVPLRTPFKHLSEYFKKLDRIYVKLFISRLKIQSMDEPSVVRASKDFADLLFSYLLQNAHLTDNDPSFVPKTAIASTISNFVTMRKACNVLHELSMSHPTLKKIAVECSQLLTTSRLESLFGETRGKAGHGALNGPSFLFGLNKICNKFALSGTAKSVPLRQDMNND
eukprot:g2961.t1